MQFFLFSKRCVKFRGEKVVCLHDVGNKYLLILLFAVKNWPNPSISREDQIFVQTHVGIPFLNVSGTQNSVFLLKLNFQLRCCEKQHCGEQEKTEEIS